MVTPAGLSALLRSSATMLLAALLAAAAVHGQARPVPAPIEVIGFEPGTDGHLAGYAKITEYFTRLAAASDRVHFETIGTTTEGRPFTLATISSPKNLGRIDALRKANARLTDPRRIKDADARAIIATNPAFILVNESIHSSEVGPAQAGMVTAHFLATTQEPEWIKVLENVVVLLTPCHNPDGYDTVVNWWDATKGDAKTRGAPLPVLYHKYVGHDNNRDWFMLTQQETRITVTDLHMRWHPQIVVDQHQMGGNGARMFVPPYIEPYEPNVHPIIKQRLEEVGPAVARALIASGRTGVWWREQFDAWTPARAFMHYHGAVRFLTEVASAGVADPVSVKRPLRGKSSKKSPTNPAPWKMGEWNLGKIVDYTSQGALLVMKHVAENRRRWLEGFWRIHVDNVAARNDPAGFLVDLTYRPEAVEKLLDIFLLGGVECSLTEVDGKPSILIRSGQPYFCFARALLENTPYPEVRTTPGGPIRRPYDVTSHNLGLLLNVNVKRLPKGSALPDAGRRIESLDAIAGIVAAGSAGWRAQIEALRGRRIGLYSPWLANMDEGWTRFLFDSLGIPFVRVRNVDMRKGDLASKIDVLLFANYGNRSDRSIREGRNDKRLPERYRGGIGDAGVEAVRAFVRGGGTVVALNGSSRFVQAAFDLPVAEVKTGSRVNPRGDPRGRFNVPGAMLMADVAGDSALGSGCDPTTPVFFWRSRAYEMKDGKPDPRVTFPVRYAQKGLVAGGYAEGTDVLRGKGAVAVARVGRGHAVLFGFSPQFRCQTWGTLPLLFNALNLGPAGQ